jgi:transcriptional regulator with XRE-family HTH domain
MLENDNSRVAIGKRLAHLRKMAKLKRDELAKLADVTGTSISLWENAKSSGPMSVRSMQKILGAFKKSGILATEEWLKGGIGDMPQKIIAPILIENASDFDHLTENHLERDTLLKLAANLSEEIQKFTSISHLSAITKIDHNHFAPFLEKGDFVGGVWQPSTALKEPKVCIVLLENGLNVGYVEKSKKDNLFNIKYNLNDPHHISGINNVILKNIAPILRIWK